MHNSHSNISKFSYQGSFVKRILRNQAGQYFVLEYAERDFEDMQIIRWHCVFVASNRQNEFDRLIAQGGASIERLGKIMFSGFGRPDHDIISKRLE